MSTPEQIQAATAEKLLGNLAYKQRDFLTAVHHYEKAWELNKDITFLINLSGQSLLLFFLWLLAVLLFWVSFFGLSCVGLSARGWMGGLTCLRGRVVSGYDLARKSRTVPHSSSNLPQHKSTSYITTSFHLVVEEG